MKVSVILCVYNEEKFIGKAIDSILNQTLDDFELIIINDGSTDNTLDIIKSYDDERIKLINQANIGLGASRNKAMEKASGEYVAFLDGDDCFFPYTLEAFNNALNMLCEERIDIVLANYINIQENKINILIWNGSSLNNYLEKTLLISIFLSKNIFIDSFKKQC